MAQSQNTHNKDIYDGRIAIASDQAGVSTVAQGDICTFDYSLNSSNGGVRAVVPGNGQADMTNYIGVSEQNSTVNSLNDINKTVIVGYRNVYNLKTTVGEVYKQFQVVYWNESADAQTITLSTNSGARAVAVGSVLLPQELMNNSVLSITGAVGVTVPVSLRPSIVVAA